MTRVYSHVQYILREGVRTKGKPDAVGITVAEGVVEVYATWGPGNDLRYAQRIGELCPSGEQERREVAGITGIPIERIPIEYHKKLVRDK